MEGSYEILLGGAPVGHAQVKREGLYYFFQCRCRFRSEVIYKLIVTCGDRTEDLGIPVPETNGFVLNTRIPVKRIGEGKLCIIAVPKHKELRGRFIPLSPTQPFDYLAQLKSAYLEKRNGQIGIIIADT